MRANTSEDIRAWCASNGVSIVGKHEAEHTHAYLRGQPILEGFAGPFGSGDASDVRYEDWKSNELLST